MLIDHTYNQNYETISDVLSVILSILLDNSNYTMYGYYIR